LDREFRELARTNQIFWGGANTIWECFVYVIMGWVSKQVNAASAGVLFRDVNVIIIMALRKKGLLLRASDIDLLEVYFPVSLFRFKVSKVKGSV